MQVSQLEREGFTVIQANLVENQLQALRESAFTEQGPGQRCLLDQPVVQKVAIALHAELVQSGFLSQSAVAIQAIAFDKTPDTNWKVTWHQDLMFPFARPVTAQGFDLPSIKQGIDYARPPKSVLEELLVVRLHLDDCDETNGPLRVSPSSHHYGILKSTELSGMVEQHGVTACLAKNGEALLMRPLCCTPRLPLPPRNIAGWCTSFITLAHQSQRRGIVLFSKTPRRTHSNPD